MRVVSTFAALVTFVGLASFACGDATPAGGAGTGPSASQAPGEPPSPPSKADGAAPDPRDASAPSDAAPSSDAASGPDAASAVATASCKSAPPAGTPRAPALPVYAGTCPALAAPPAYTTISSSGANRQFLVYKPAAPAAGEKLPVVFLWHWLGGSPEDVASRLGVQAAVDARRFVAVIPAPKGDALFRWPFEATQSQARVDEEAKYFDDMLACVGAGLTVEKECVSSVGVSAGALWTAQLATVRSERLASFVSLSGGVGDVVRPWAPAARKLPGLVLWGGANDTYPSQVPIMNFDRASKRLESSLVTDGHFFLECVHNCGHDVPPFDAPPAGGLVFEPVWRFVLDHPYWLGAGQSPYTSQALPAAFPSWCGKGQGGATPRPAGAACP